MEEDTALAFYERMQVYYDAIAQALQRLGQAIYDHIVVPFANALPGICRILREAGFIRHSKQTRHFLSVKCAHQLQRAKVARRIEQRRMKRLGRALARREFYMGV